MWKHILMLEDWIIGIELSDEETDSPNWGESSNWRAIRVAKIIIPQVVDKDRFPAKYCQELILVHELLHVKLLPPDTQDEILRNEWHAILEELAKGYVMARYDLDFSWFENINEVLYG